MSFEVRTHPVTFKELGLIGTVLDRACSKEDQEFAIISFLTLRTNLSRSEISRLALSTFVRIVVEINDPQLIELTKTVTRITGALSKKNDKNEPSLNLEDVLAELNRILRQGE